MEHPSLQIFKNRVDKYVWESNLVKLTFLQYWSKELSVLGTDHPPLHVNMKSSSTMLQDSEHLE